MSRHIVLDSQQLLVDPIELDLHQVASRLDAGMPVSITMEPGDATRYELLLVPMWAENVALHNWSYEDRQHGLVVTRLVGGEVERSAVVLLNRQSPGIYDVAGRNRHTQLFFDAWFSRLAASLAEERTEAQPQRRN